MGGKKSGAARTPNIEKNTLYSYQKLKTIDLTGAGEIAGFFHGDDYPLKSIYLNDTPIQNADESLNHSGVSVQFSNGAIDQGYLPGFTSVDNAVSVGSEVEQKVPITRTVVNPLITSVRVTVGVDALFQSHENGDQTGTSVDMSIQIIKNGSIYTSQNMHLNEKGSQPFRLDFVFNDVPEAPFDIKCTRLTEDSKDDMLRNKTFFFSYVESIDAKFRYPKTAVIGMELDSKQFGNNNPTRTYLLKGSIIQVPSNYDAENRTYTGLWDRTLKPAFTNNPAWILYDLLTDEIDGFGERFKNYSIDIDKLYELSKYCDELVDDGNGGKEPRFVCNIVLFGGEAYDVIYNICSVFRGLPAFSNDKFTIYYDRKTDVSAVYNNSNVVDGLFEYSMVARTEQYNQIQVEYVDKDDGYRTKIDELSDEKHILKNGLNTQSIVAYGCTKRSYALRCAKWNLVTNLTENEKVYFKVGASGIRHELYDILKIADNDYVGVPIAGRIESAEGNIITLDRDLSNVKNFTINVNGKTELFTVKKVIDDKTYEVDKTVNIIDYAPFVATLNNVEPRLFRCIGITEEDEGVYSITCIKHNPQKEAIVDKGAEYTEGNYTIINPLPALSNGIVVSEGRVIILEWDALTVIGSVNKYIIKLFKDSDIYHSYTATETRLKLENLPQGNYTASIRAINEQGQYSDELVIAFSTSYEITGLRYSPIVFGISLFWEVPALITTNAYTEVWWSKKDDRSTATIAAKLPYPQNNYTVTNLSVKDSRYFWFRLVDEDGNQGEFTRSLYTESSSDAKNILDYLVGQITTDQLAPGVINEIIEDSIEEIKEELKDDVNAIIEESEIIESINKKVENAELENQLLELSKVTADRVVYAETSINRVSIDNNSAEMILQKLSEVTADKQLVSNYMSLLAENERAKAEILLSQIAKTTDYSSLVQEISSLTASYLDNSASIDTLREATAGEFEATAKSLELIKTDVSGNKSSIDSLKQTTSDLESATAKELTSIKSEVGSNKSAIDSLSKTTASDQKATAEKITNLESKTDKTNATVNEHWETTANIDGTVKSQYTLTTGTIGADGQKIVSGFTSLNDGKTSEFVIQADKFAIINVKNGETRTPFVLAENKLALNGDLIATGSITGSKIIANAEITSPRIMGGELNIGNGRFKVSATGEVTIVAEIGKKKGLQVTSTKIVVFDENGIDRVTLGEL